MTFFILKKPAFISFNHENYSDNTALMSKHQILSNESQSNAALVRHRDGTWYIKYGKELLELRSMKCKKMCIAKIEEGEGEMVEKVENKWFLQNTVGL